MRSLIDTQDIQIKPLTFLLGSNSSGKSTFLRTFPLLRQSTEANTVGAILWYGTYVDFGTHDDAKNRYSNNNEISFSFSFDLNSVKRPSSVKRSINFFNTLNSRNLDDFIPGKYTFDLKLIIECDSNGQSRTKSITITFEDHIISFDIAQSSDGISHMHDVTVNGTSIEIDTDTYRLFKAPRTLLPQLLPGQNYFSEKIIALIKKYSNKKISDDALDHTFELLKLGSSSQMLALMKEIKDKKIWQKNVQKWDEDTPDFKELKNYLIIAGLIGILNSSNRYLSNMAIQSRYIAPVRANVDRYYRMQDLAIDEVDFQGQNLPMYLYSLNRDKRKSLKTWAFDNFGFSPTVKRTGGHISMFIDFNNKNTVNVADLGFGFSQILPILVQLWALTNYSNDKFRYSHIPYIITIEQPELHLHPSMQAQLADVFAKVTRFAFENDIDLRLIIETHSETIINRMGHLIEKQKLDSKNINVLIFNKKYDDEYTNIDIAKFTADGYLENWPYGFFEPDLNFNN